MAISPHRIVPYARRGMIYLINNIANRLSAENNGKIDDVFRIDMVLKQELLKNPERIDLDKYVSDCRKKWAKLNHEVLIPDGMTGVRFVPGAYLVLGKRAMVMMKKASPTDVIAWQQVDDEAKANFLRTLDAREAFRNQRLREFAANRDCQTLGDIETKLHGYVEVPADEEAHLITTPRDVEPDDLAASA